MRPGKRCDTRQCQQHRFWGLCVLSKPFECYNRRWSRGNWTKCICQPSNKYGFFRDFRGMFHWAKAGIAKADADRLNCPQGSSDAPHAPVLMGWASPLRVATGGAANCGSGGRRRRSPAHENRRRDFVISHRNRPFSVRFMKIVNEKYPGNPGRGPKRNRAPIFCRFVLWAWNFAPPTIK